MRRLKSAARVALLAAALWGCSGDAPAPRTDATTRALLARPRPEELSTAFDAQRLASGEPALPIDLLGVNLGSDAAPLKVIEFVDYGCGFCRQFQIETFPALRAEFIETDKVEWKFLPFITDMFANSRAVTAAAECALEQSPRLFGLLSDRLWVQQRDWKGSSEPEGLVRGWFVEMGGDGTAYDACLASGAREDRITSANAVAAQLGVRATPTFWIVGAGPLQGALPLDAFREVFNQISAQLADTVG
jgi:protein-disulfide isomerase